MNDKKAHEQLKKINAQRNKIGIGGYKDSRRERCKQNEIFNTTMGDLNKERDDQAMKENDDDQ